LIAHVSIAPVTDEGALVAMLLLGLAALLATTALVDRRGLLTQRAVPFGRWTAVLAAGLSLGAAAIHFGVIGDHFAEYPPYGVAFAALAWFQVGWAIAYLAAPARRVAAVGAAINAGAIVVWLLSRTVGLPIGPEPGELEPVGPLDVLASAMELALIGLLLWNLAGNRIRLRPALSATSATAVVGSGLLMIVVSTSAAFAAAGADGHGAEGPPAGEATAEPSPSAVPGSEAPPALTGSPPAATPGVIRFGTSLGLDGVIATPEDTFTHGASAVWIAEFVEPPDVPTILLIIVAVLPDGRVFEHWRQEIPLADPAARQLVAGADLSIYVHGGEGTYRLRYLRGDELLAEGTFVFIP
jgi:hypothetical protein